jgi:pyridoxine 5-phosphate synthase
MPTLGVNIDHIATLRQARLGKEPDTLFAASIAEQNGADQITIHLREDRRHIQLWDLKMLRKTIQTKLNLEMASVDEIVNIACSIKPDTVTLVPEKREELTTEGGLNLKIANIEKHIEMLKDNNIEVSIFIEPNLEIIKLAKKLGVDAIEIHTGRYANLSNKNEINNELIRIKKAAKLVKAEGMRLVAGHGLNYHNILPLVQLNLIEEYNIGHSIISRAVFWGMAEAVSKMKSLINSVL